jgi:hypothetical protein
MLTPACKEWDEYFSMCEMLDRMRENPHAKRVTIEALSAAVVSKIRQCRLGIYNIERTDMEKVEVFLRDNQLSSLLEISRNTGIGHDRLKEIFFNHRKKFFIFRADANGDDSVCYSVLEEDISLRKCKTKSEKDRVRIDRKCLVARWMRYRGFIDPKFFHQPMNMTMKDLTRLLRSLGYSYRGVQFGDENRDVFFGDSNGL